MTPNEISRRNFLKGAGLGVAVAGLAPHALALDTEKPGGCPMLGPGRSDHTFFINGTKRTVAVEPSLSLLDMLRDRLDLTGAKRVCDRAACGSCTVLIDGVATLACSTLAVDASGGKAITTIEGLAPAGALSPLQKAFVECDALQCGFCTPGMVMACHAVLEKHPNPSRAEIAAGIAGNICRCGTYKNIFEAVELAASRKGGAGGK